MSEKRLSQGEDIEDELNMFKGLPQAATAWTVPFVLFIHSILKLEPFDKRELVPQERFF